MSLHKCIIVKAAGLMVQHEFVAGEAGIYPGHLLEQTTAAAASAGPQTALRDNRASTVGGPVIVAIENPYLPPGTKDTVYASGDTVYGRAVVPGSEYQARLAPNAAAIVVNDSLTRDGDGMLKKAAAADEIVAVALEAVNNSAGGTQVFILVRAR